MFLWLPLLELPSTALSVQPNERTVTAGEDVVFHCKYRDGPAAAIRWQRKGGTLPFKRHSTKQNGDLILEKVQPDDEGQYVCSVTSAGGLRATATLKVQSM